MKSINLCFEEAETELMHCSKCSQPILSLHQATSFLKTAPPQAKLYFALELTLQEDSSSSPAYVVNENSIYTEVRESFFLMEAAKVHCGTCRLQIGIFLGQASEQQQQWLVNTILFDPEMLDFSPKQLKGELISKLLEEMNEEEEEQQVDAQGKAADQEELVYTDIVNEALSNITFYSDVIDQLKERFQAYLMLQKYEKVKKSTAKSKQREDS